MTFNLSVILLFLLFTSVQLEPIAVDPNGYVAYCGCMGRFGNQADHFLGTLAFTNAINRTLILPPWVEYRRGQSKSIQVKFDKYFKVQPLSEFTKVITMEDFMENLAETVWPEDKRISFCYTERIGLDGRSTQSCNAKDGNPFFSFWDHFKIDFTGSEFYGPNMNYDIHHRNMGEQWQKKYNSEEWSVIAFTGAPATFPVQKENLHLQKYLQWSDEIDKAADEFIKTVLPKGAFIGIHLRNGMDWIRACDHVKDTKNLFASPQCLGYNGEKGALSMDICLPGKDIIVRKIKRLIKKVKDTTVTNQIRSIFVASDNNHMIEGLNESLRRMNIKAFKLNDNNPHVDLAILGRSNFFIGNCVSSYSSFVKRERDVRGFPSEFWGYPIEKSQKGNAATSKQHEEL